MELHKIFKGPSEWFRTVYLQFEGGNANRSYRRRHRWRAIEHCFNDAHDLLVHDPARLICPTARIVIWHTSRFLLQQTMMVHAIPVLLIFLKSCLRVIAVIKSTAFLDYCWVAIDFLSKTSYSRNFSGKKFWKILQIREF